MENYTSEEQWAFSNNAWINGKSQVRVSAALSAGAKAHRANTIYIFIHEANIKDVNKIRTLKLEIMCYPAKGSVADAVTQTKGVNTIWLKGKVRKNTKKEDLGRWQNH
jgi:hypothetical protein